MKNIKILLAFLHDFFAIIFSFLLAYSLRFNFLIPDDHLQVLFGALPPIVLISTFSFYFVGLYRGVWRFASITDLKRIIGSVFLASLISIAFFFMYKKIGMIPRSVLVIHPLLLILFMGGSRFIYRTFKEHQIYGLKASLGEPVIIIGSGQNAILLAKELSLTNDLRVVGILNDDAAMHGRELAGTRILGSIKQYPNSKKNLIFIKPLLLQLSSPIISEEKLLKWHQI
jgi:FlaA1/EpsC-like NDP-sugar epimerase